MGPVEQRLLAEMQADDTVEEVGHAALIVTTTCAFHTSAFIYASVCPSSYTAPAAE